MGSTDYVVVLRTAGNGAELPMQLRGNSVRSCPFRSLRDARFRRSLVGGYC
jgi:hypothetical protein